MIVGAERASFEAVRGGAEARAEMGGGQAGQGAGPGESRAVLAGADDEGRAAVGWVRLNWPSIIHLANCPA